VLGDFNTVIHPYNESQMTVFLDDDINFEFSDISLAQNSNHQEYWSYPTWPSHLDHILISNELFDDFVQTSTLTLNKCSPAYFTRVSDHRPVISIFN
jgi:exonuclease III